MNTSCKREPCPEGNDEFNFSLSEKSNKEDLIDILVIVIDRLEDIKADSGFILRTVRKFIEASGYTKH